MLPDMEPYNVRELDPVVAKTCHLLFEKLGQKQNRNLIKKLCAKKIHAGLLNVQKNRNTTIQNTELLARAFTNTRKKILYLTMVFQAAP